MPLIGNRGNGNGPPAERDPNAPITHTSAMTRRVRRLFAMERDNALAAAERIRRSIQAVGRSNIDTELGDDAAELITAYAALKAFILTLDPDAEVPDLTE